MVLDPGSIPGMRELDASWSAKLDQLAVDSSRLRRQLVSLLILMLSLLFSISIQLRYPPLVPEDVDWSVRPSNTSAVSDFLGVGARFEGSRSNISTDVKSYPNRLPFVTARTLRKFDAIPVPKAPLPRSHVVRTEYARLARAYLRPFAKGIQRSSYMDLLEGAMNGSSNACSGCFLIQIKNQQIYAYDPLAIRSKAATFRELRMREALHWARLAVASGAINNTEFVVSTTDGVASTSRNHSFRMGAPRNISHPIFTVSRCNISDNIPFPMVFTDLLRRGFPDRFWTKRAGTLRQWDRIASEGIGAQIHESHVWARKLNTAVFRGSIRTPASVKSVEDYDRACSEYGRTALFARAEAEKRKLPEPRPTDVVAAYVWRWLSLPLTQGVAEAMNTTTRWATRKIASYTGSHIEEKDVDTNAWTSGSGVSQPLLDVQLSGKCGKRLYKSDRLDMEQQTQYKYTVHVEGNGFWADRLAIQLFGSSAVIKQHTPCGMFFEPLLRAYKHYVPVDYHFRDILEQVSWAVTHDEETQQIVRNARNFAGNYLTTAGIQAYAEELLVQYTDLLEHKDNIEVHPSAVKLYPLNRRAARR